MTTQKNRTALITGGSRGLGRNMAISLAKKGIDVIITYNSNKTEADKVVAEIQSLGQQAAAFQLDTGDSKTFDSFLKQISEYLASKTGSANFDFLINNAGAGINVTAFAGLKVETWLAFTDGIDSSMSIFLGELTV